MTTKLGKYWKSSMRVTFPMAGEKAGWARLAKNLKAEIDADLVEAYRGTESLPFEPGVTEIRPKG